MPCPPPADLPNPGIEPKSLTLQTDSLPTKSPGKPKKTGVGSLPFLQGNFPTQGSNPGHSHCWWILYQLSHKGSPRMLEWVACPFPSESSQPRSRTGVSCIAGGSFTNWAIREARYVKPNRFTILQLTGSFIIFLVTTISFRVF